MLFMILMIIGATLPAAATAPSHTPVPTATGVDGGGAAAPSAAGGGGGSPAGAAFSLSVDNANETIALDMLGLAIPAQLRQAYGRARGSWMENGEIDPVGRDRIGRWCC